ncbi:MAG: FAD-binding oxidoreductase [Chloroflexota bacterium]|nr:FAD-binding oxidoreductase [Chloroflexota bacterium]
MARGQPTHADVVVIGGGIAGTATAAFLAETGASVVLVEREAIAAGASGRNSGIVQAPLDSVLAGLYRDTLTEYRRLELGGDGAFALPAEPSGLLHVTRTPAIARRLTEELAATHPELRPEFLDGDALAWLEPSLDPAVSACRVAIGFPVAPAAATGAYAAMGERHGVRIGIGLLGELIRRGEAIIGVRTSGDERILAGAVVVAAGPWTPAIVDPSGRWRPIRPLWGVVAEVALASPPRHVLEEAEIDGTIEPASAAPADPTDGLAFSLVTVAGRTVLGSTFLDDEPDPDAFVPAIRRRGARFVPALADAPILGTRRCARPLSVDGRPLVGRVPWLEGLFVLAGHGPWGISTAPGSARMLADLVLGRRAGVPDALDPARFGGP